MKLANGCALICMLLALAGCAGAYTGPPDTQRFEENSHGRPQGRG